MAGGGEGRGRSRGRPSGRGRGRRRSRSDDVDQNIGGGSRRRNAESNTAAASNSSSSTTPVAAPSIRATARLSSRSSGSQHSQDSSGSMYNLEYRRSRNNSSPLTGGGTNLNAARLNPRMCICDQQMFPINCSGCDIANNNHCEYHAVVNCTQQGCTNKFHKGCLCSGVFTDATLEQLSQQYICMECKCKLSAEEEEDTPFADLPRNASPTHNTEALLEKLCRVGLGHDVAFASNAQEKLNALRSGKTEMEKLWKALQKCNSCLPDGLGDEANEILDSKPRAYPCPVGISDESVNKHVQCGRRAELSMLLYNVQQCGCCGSVKPDHSDPCFSKRQLPPYSRMHLINPSHKAWHCTCRNYCKGSQFYAHDRPKVMAHYESKHDGLRPRAYGDQNDGCVSETLLCQKCYEEIEGGNANGKLLLLSF